uniref:Iron-sulfur cluster co-chaperone protein HscB, mitochondrial n=1 Tax=Varanus komodoensis TaxID=61221 RepID=A0A8D2L372_VARKO
MAEEPLQAALWGALACPRWALPGTRVHSAQPSGRCWSCGDPLAGSGSPAPCFCPACRALQPLEPRQDLFRLIGCDCTFCVDVTLLQQCFRTLQRLLHPDYFSRRPQREQDFSEQHSSLVNKAYQTLLNPLSRRLYLLELNEVELEEGTDTEADPEFLLEIMEKNEKLSEVHNDAKIEEIENGIAAKQAELIASVSGAFEKDDLQEAKKLLAKMKYFAKLEEKVKKRRIPS